MWTVRARRGVSRRSGPRRGGERDDHRRFRQSEPHRRPHPPPRRWRVHVERLRDLRLRHRRASGGPAPLPPHPPPPPLANPPTPRAGPPVPARRASCAPAASRPVQPNQLVPSLALGPPPPLPAPAVPSPAVAAPEPTTPVRPDVELTRPGGFSSGAWWQLTAPQAVAVGIVGVGALAGVAAMARTRVAAVDSALRAVPAWLWRLRFGRRR